MIINCKYCDTELDVNVEQVTFDGGLIKCGKCQEEWFQKSESQYLEKKLIELDENLHATETHLIEKKNIHSDKIVKLENVLKVKKKELAKQKLLEERISLFEKRITDTEKEIAAQSLVENRITQLEKEIKQNSSETLVVNTNLERKTKYLQRKIHSEGLSDRLDNLENDVHDAKKSVIKDEIVDSEKPNLIKEIKIVQNFKENRTDNVKEIKKKEVFDTKKTNKLFFWKKNNNTTPIIENLNSSQYGATQPDTWDLSEETIEHELKELKRKKKKSS